MRPISILASGMMTSVGASAPAACAAIRCGINGFQETRFIDKGGEWIIGAPVHLKPPCVGLPKLVHMSVCAIGECLAAANGVKPEHIVVLLCVAEMDRPGRIQGIDRELFEQIKARLGVSFHPASAVIANGRVGGVEAMKLAENLLSERSVSRCLLAGVDSFLVGTTLEAYQSRHRLLTSRNSNGFIPGEAATAVLLGNLATNSGPALTCLGVGFGNEEATVESDKAFRADGLTQALRDVCVQSHRTFDDVGYRITDLNGEQYGFKEATLAIARTVRNVKPQFDIWHPVECIGEVGAAIVPCVLGIAHAAAVKEYAPAAGVLCHFANDQGQRAAMILNYGELRAA